MRTGRLANARASLQYLRWWHWGVFTVGALWLTALLVRQPLTRLATHRALSAIPGWQADAADAHLSFFPLVYSVSRLRLVPEDRSLPIFYIERLDTGAFWGDLLRLRINAWANLERVKMTFFLIPIHIPDLAAMLQKVMPLAIARVQCKHGEITIAFRHSRSDDPQKPEGSGPQLWFHDVEAAVEGLATRAELEPHATTLALRSTMARTGQVSAFVTVDLLTPGAITFSGQLELVGLHLADLDSVLQPSGLRLAGTFDLKARFGVDHGKLTGALEPVLKHGRVEALGGEVGKQLELALADDGIQLLSDRVPGRDALVTIIPLHGTLNRPQLDVWAAVSGVLRNAFVVGLSESLRKLPAPTPENQTPASVAHP